MLKLANSASGVPVQSLRMVRHTARRVPIILCVTAALIAVQGNPGGASGADLPAAAVSVGNQQLSAIAIGALRATLDYLPGLTEGPVPSPGANPLAIRSVYENGKVPTGVLMALGPSCRLEEEMGRRLRALLRASAAAGYPMQTISCYRDYASQAALYAEAVAAGRGESVAAPGRSNHGYGLAADIWPVRLAAALNQPEWYNAFTFDSPEWQWLDAHAARFGLIFYLRRGVIPEEPWHIEAVEVRR